MEQNGSFHYTYSAAQQEEIAAIRKKYAADSLPEAEDKMEQLRRLDRSVAKKAMTLSLVVGILSALVMGSGMSLVMTDLGGMLGIARPLIPGVLVGLTGMAGVIAAYPLHQIALKKERKKIAPRILQLTEELTQ